MINSKKKEMEACHIENIIAFEKKRNYDWALNAVIQLSINENTVFRYKNNDTVIMPLSFIATQVIEFNRAEDLVLDCINRTWWLKDNKEKRSA